MHYNTHVHVHVRLLYCINATVEQSYVIINSRSTLQRHPLAPAGTSAGLHSTLPWHSAIYQEAGQPGCCAGIE